MSHLSLTYCYFLGAMFLLLGFSACSESNEPSVPEPEQKIMSIRWDVQQEGMEEGRALINNDAVLQNACSIGGKAIGIWSAYELDGEVTENVLGEDQDVSLVYNQSLIGNDEIEWDHWEGWTYGEEAAEWVAGATYHFNAYFPKGAIEEIPSSDITTFVARYNTVTTQDDLMLAYTTTAVPITPVPLNLHHALAALKFKFRFSDEFTEVSDKLTACWLENTDEWGLCTQGLFEFGVGGAGEALTWELENSAYPATGTPFYEWKDTNGLPMSASTTNMATAYTTGDYAENEGWLLIIPQESDGTVNICFQTENAGSVVHRVALPMKTGTTQMGTSYSEGTWFAPARRYTYNLVITPTTVKVTLGIDDWNELESSYDISF